MHKAEPMARNRRPVGSMGWDESFYKYSSYRIVTELTFHKPYSVTVCLSRFAKFRRAVLQIPGPWKASHKLRLARPSLANFIVCIAALNPVTPFSVQT